LHPPSFLSLADNLKALDYAAVAISTGRSDIGVRLVADAGLTVLGQRLKVLIFVAHDLL
jgi:hypothetical protein